MIFSSIHANDDLNRYPEAIKKAILFLKENDFASMEPGEYEIDGRNMFAKVFDADTEVIEKRRPEAHEKYVDVQFLVTGKEKLGFTPNTGKYEVAMKDDAEDLIFYKEVENEGYIEATPGCYSVFFPNDVHRPQIASGEPMKVRKVVVKVSVSIL